MSKPKKLEQLAREFSAQVLSTMKRPDPKADRRREQREAQVAKALDAHLAKRKK